MPKEEQLAFDPYGITFAPGRLSSMVETVLFAPELFRAALPRLRSLHAFLLWMQLRTRALDDVLEDFVVSGGKQVVLLGAGYDARAIRFAHVLKDARLFEVDHPATQSAKRAAVARAELRTQARYVSWDFEQGYEGLRDKLCAAGLTPNQRVLTLWEGVTMYLSERAIQQTLALVKSYGASDSWLAFTYIDKRALHAPRGDQRLTQRLVRGVGEPHRFGFDPHSLPAWLKQHDYQLRSDVTDHDLALQYLSEPLADFYRARNRHIALATM